MFSSKRVEYFYFWTDDYYVPFISIILSRVMSFWFRVVCTLHRRRFRRRIFWRGDFVTVCNLPDKIIRNQLPIFTPRRSLRIKIRTFLITSLLRRLGLATFHEWKFILFIIFFAFPWYFSIIIYFPKLFIMPNSSLAVLST